MGTTLAPPPRKSHRQTEFALMLLTDAVTAFIEFEMRSRQFEDSDELREEGYSIRRKLAQAHLYARDTLHRDDAGAKLSIRG